MLDVDFRVAVPEVDESQRAGELGDAYLERVGALKAAAAEALAQDELGVLVADTVVLKDGLILGKPQDEAAARALLRRLAGGWHEVATRFVLRRRDDGRSVAETVRTRVHFRTLDDAAIAAHAASGEGADKAGGYAIQGRAAAFVTRIEGSYTNVVGLPVAEVALALETLGLGR